MNGGKKNKCLYMIPIAHDFTIIHCIAVVWRDCVSLEAGARACWSLEAGVRACLPAKGRRREGVRWSGGGWQGTPGIIPSCRDALHNF